MPNPHLSHLWIDVAAAVALVLRPRARTRRPARACSDCRSVRSQPASRRAGGRRKPVMPDAARDPHRRRRARRGRPRRGHGPRLRELAAAHSRAAGSRRAQTLDGCRCGNLRREAQRWRPVRGGDTRGGRRGEGHPLPRPRRERPRLVRRVRGRGRAARRRSRSFAGGAAGARGVRRSQRTRHLRVGRARHGRSVERVGDGVRSPGLPGPMSPASCRALEGVRSRTSRPRSAQTRMASSGSSG